jgi:hypothetical protein
LVLSLGTPHASKLVDIHDAIKCVATGFGPVTVPRKLVHCTTILALHSWRLVFVSLAG